MTDTTSNIKPGATGTAELTVGEEHTAPRVGSGKIRVLATPVMINLIEAAALKAAEHLLPQGIRVSARYSTSSTSRPPRSA